MSLLSTCGPERLPSSKFAVGTFNTVSELRVRDATLTPRAVRFQDYVRACIGKGKLAEVSRRKAKQAEDATTAIVVRFICVTLREQLSIGAIVPTASDPELELLLLRKARRQPRQRNCVSTVGH